MSESTAEASRLGRSEIHRLTHLYNLEDYLFEQVSRRFAEEQTLIPFDFFAIVIWKSSRVKTRVKKGLDDAGRTVRTLMNDVAKARRPEDKVRLLTQLDGIGIPVASAILAVCYPSRFTVLDHRAWETLADCDLEGLPGATPTTPESYVRYCEACARFAAREGVSLRDLDRDLWGRSWENDLNDLIEGMEA